MRTRHVAALAALLAAGPAGAQQAPLRLLSSNGVKATVEALHAQAEHAAGRAIAADFSTTTALKDRIARGEAFDATILTREAIGDLIAQGKVKADSRTPLARVGIGLGIREGAAKPDIATPEAMKQALLKARSITYTKGGASQPDIEKMFAGLGIAEQVRPKVILEPPGQSPASVAAGKAEMVMTLISEILPVAGVQLVGPLPKEFQHYSYFEGGISPAAKDPAGAAAFLKFLAGPQAGATFKSKGMER